MKWALATGLVLCFACTNGSNTSGLTLFPSTTLYSGAEAGGGATYRVTIAAMGGSGITWASADSSVASVTGTDALGTVTALKAGSTIIRGTAAGTTISVPLTVNTYSSSDRMAGATAWTTTYNCARGGCHDSSGPDVSPSDIGKHTDAQVQAAITMGQNPEGGSISIGAAAHSFAIGPGTPEYAGIVAYMRTLAPGTPVQDN